MKKAPPPVIAIVVAAGNGKRYGQTKQFVELGQHCVLWYSTRIFAICPRIHRVDVIVKPSDEQLAHTKLKDFNEKVRILPVGGKTRSDSVRNGLTHCNKEDWVLVHDAARPCLTMDCINRLLDKREDDNGAILALPVTDALKLEKNNQVINHLSRDNIWMAQTPQLFIAEQLKHALEASPNVADEAEAMTRLNKPPHIVIGDRRNIKITYPEDIMLAKILLHQIDDAIIS